MRVESSDSGWSAGRDSGVEFEGLGFRVGRDSAERFEQMDGVRMGSSELQRCLTLVRERLDVGPGLH